MSRLRCPLRTPEVILVKLADGGADTGAGCLVSMGCGTAFGGYNEVLGFGGNTSAIFDVSMAVLGTTYAKLSVVPDLFAGIQIQGGSCRDWQLT